MRVKICGLREASHIDVAAQAGAAYIGLVFFAKSPRAVGLDHARALALGAPAGLSKVALTVDMNDAELDALVQHVPMDMLQLNGAETPERVAKVKARTGLPVMKAVGLRTAEDLTKIDSYTDVADQILVDAKPPPGGDLPGGNGLTFDWRLIEGHRWPLPWMLAGGLTTENVGEAVRRTGATQLDLSSGVESAPGVKDPAKIKAFLEAATLAGLHPAPSLG
ncbi:MAG: phosphoribosylanthranilate isomerase [Pseudomonadota bacterium]